MSKKYKSKSVKRERKVGNLGPGQSMVKVVFHLVVFWQTQEVTVLHIHKILGLKSNMRDNSIENLIQTSRTKTNVDFVPYQNKKTVIADQNYKSPSYLFIV